MDGTLKIKALMIYFEHWGKEEKRVYENIHGIKNFRQCIDRKYSNYFENSLKVLKDTDKTPMSFWRSLSDCLLSGMDHWVEYYDYTTKPLHIKIKFADMNGVMFHDLIQLGLDPMQMKYVDAILALPVLR